MPMMQMTFYWSENIVILFENWRTTSADSYYCSLILLFFIAYVNQYLDALTNARYTILWRKRHIADVAPASTDLMPKAHLPCKDKDNDEEFTMPHTYGKQTTSGIKILLACLFLVRVSVSYLLMLAVMSFNGGVFIAVVLGLSVGYFVFRIRLQETAAEQEAEYNSDYLDCC